MPVAGRRHHSIPQKPNDHQKRGSALYSVAVTGLGERTKKVRVASRLNEVAFLPVLELVATTVANMCQRQSVK